MNGEEVQDKDLNAEFRNIDANSSGFDAMEEEEALLGVDERQIWLANEQYNLLANFHDASILYTDHLPPLPHDFPCMLPSSSSSSIPAPVKAITCSSSSSSTSSSSYAASWVLLKSDAEEDEDQKKCRFNHGQHDPMDAPPAALASTASTETPKPLDGSLEGVDCMDVMETLGYMDLSESNDFFDPSYIFRSDNPLEDFKQLEQMSREEHAMQENAHREHEQLISQTKNKETQVEKDPEDMATVFLEWLRTNKETVSAEDLRSVRIKKATIESAAKRLGGGKEAMKQLLKLVLEWVQSNHLKKSRSSKEESTHFPNQYHDPFQNPNPNANLNSNSTTPESNPCFTALSTWIPQRDYVPEPTAVLEAPSAYPPMVGYIGTGPYTDHGASNINDHSPYTATMMEYQMPGSSHPWPPSQLALASHYNSFPGNSFHPAPKACAGYGNQYPHQHYFSGHQDKRLLRFGSSATKEARKKRMARQRRFLSHHRHHHNNHNQQNQHPSQNKDQHARLGNDNCNTAAQANPGNWMYWPSVTANGGAASASPVMPVEVAMGHPADQTAAMQGQNFPGRVASDKRQGWKPEKNLRFLLQKVLKQSDVGNLGRIVLPKGQ